MLRIYKITSSFQTDRNCERIISKQLLKQHHNFKLQNHYVSDELLCSNKTMTTILQTGKIYAPCYQWSMGELKTKQFRRFLQTQPAWQPQTAPQLLCFPTALCLGLNSFPPLHRWYTVNQTLKIWHIFGPTGELNYSKFKN